MDITETVFNLQTKYSMSNYNVKMLNKLNSNWK